MFFHVPRIVRYISDFVGKLSTHYLVENVEMTDDTKRIFTEYLDGIRPWKVDFNSGGCCASLMSRRRLYFTSVMPDGGQLGLNNFARANCIHPAKAEGKKVDDVLAALGFGDWKFANAIDGTLPTLTRREHQGGQERYIIQHREDTTRTRDAPQILNEDLLGFPLDHTKRGVDNRLLTEAERRLLLGNTFCVYHVQYLMKKMHEIICEPPSLYELGGKIPKLPQDLTADKLTQTDLSRKDEKLYSDTSEVISGILKFQDYDNNLKGTLWASLIPKRNA